MTTPMVDTVRTIPLIVENCVPMVVDDAPNDDDSGFPFDRDTRDESLRSQLDDIAKRHPEFAEHLEGFPFRSNRTRPPRPSDEAEFRRFRPFGSSRFERFGFPFSRDPFEEDYQRPEEYQSRSETTSQSPPPPPTQHQKETQEKQTQTLERGRQKPIQQSNTVDLGQKQEPVNDRNQRSMSAPPPDNRSGQKRYVSSINIPINRDGGMGDMGTQQSQPQQQQEKPTNKPMERVIPIHVEGRDEPVIPKHTGPSFSQQPPPQPQPERIFGHRPSQFTQFVGREPRQYGAGPEWHHPAYTKQEPIPTDNMKQQQQQQQKFQQQQQKSQEQVPPQQQQQQQQEQEQPQPQPPKQSNNPIDIIQAIQKDVSELMGQVEKFNGVPRDKQYLYLDEMLTRNLIKLDNIDTQGQENIRQARKEAIKCIESCISILDAKAAANVPQTPKETTSEEKMEETNVDNQVEEAKTEGCQEKVEESPQSKPEESQPKVEESQNKIEEPQPLPAPEDNKMEVTEDKPAETVAEPPQQQQQPPPEEDKMEVVSEPTIPTIPSSEPIPLHPPKEIIEEKPKEETSEKPDEEMKDVPQEDKKENEVKEENKEDNDDKKEKKKGKKKVIKK